MVYPLTLMKDPFTKYQWLTGTSVVQGLPSCVTDLETPIPGEKGVLREMEERVAEVLAFQFHVRDDPTRLNKHIMGAGLLQGMLATIWPLAGGQTEIQHLAQSYLTFNPEIECYWRRNRNNFLCHANPMYILHTTKPLGLLCPPDCQDGERSWINNDDDPDFLPYQPNHLNLHLQSFDQIKPFPGSKRRGPYVYCHTLFVEDKRSRSLEQTLAHGLMQMFAQAASMVVQNGFMLDRDALYPQVNQCIITNGKSFTFLCYQLNTLDLAEDQKADGKGRRNILWVGPTLDLYENVKYGFGLESFNEECARLFLRFVLKVPTREAFSVSGFLLKKTKEKLLEKEWKLIRKKTKERKEEQKVVRAATKKEAAKIAAEKEAARNAKIKELGS